MSKRKNWKDQVKFINWIKFLKSRSRNENCETPDETKLERTRFPKADIILKFEITFLWLLEKNLSQHKYDGQINKRNIMQILGLIEEWNRRRNQFYQVLNFR